MKHNLLSTAAVLLLVLLTWSCTTDEEPVPTPATSTPRDLSITIGPRPAYTAGTTLSATRVIQTPDGTAAAWEIGDVLWLDACFFWTPAGGTETDKVYISALRYNGEKWLPLTVQDSLDLNTSSIKPAVNGQGFHYCGFTRRLQWPAEALAEGTTGAKINVVANYLGKGIPVDGILSMDYTTDYMSTSSKDLFSPGTPITLNPRHYYTRLHVTNKAELSLENAYYIYEHDLSSGSRSNSKPEFLIFVPDEGGYYFMDVSVSSKIFLDGNAYTLVPGIDEDGQKNHRGMTYTLVPLKNGTTKPGDL